MTVDYRQLDLEGVLHEVRLEVEAALELFPPMNSPHEGYAVILEELDELWDEVKANNGRTGAARNEAIQVAAMAVRYILDMKPTPMP